MYLSRLEAAAPAPESELSPFLCSETSDQSLPPSQLQFPCLKGVNKSLSVVWLGGAPPRGGQAGSVPGLWLSLLEFILTKCSGLCGSCLATRAHQVPSVPRKTSRPASRARQVPKGQFSREGQAWGLKSQRWVLLGSGKPLARNICDPQGRSQRWIQHLML